MLYEEFDQKSCPKFFYIDAMADLADVYQEDKFDKGTKGLIEEI
jgi:hypothetical protein